MQQFINQKSIVRKGMFVLVLAALAGCDDSSSSSKPAVLPSHASEPAAQTAPDSAAPSAGANATNAPTANAPSDAGVTWKLPPGWTQREGSNMRLATLTSDSAVEVSVTGFGGQAGGLVLNINRWRGQVGLPNLSDAEAINSTQKIPTAGGEATLVDVAGTGADAQRLIAAIVPGTGKTFFFKMMGPPNRLEEAKAGFLALMKTVKADAAQ